MSLSNTVQGFHPVYYYQFNRPNKNYYYTNSSKTRGINGVTTVAESISHGDIKSTGREGKRPINIVLPLENELAQQFISYFPEGSTSVTIYQADLTDDTLSVVWKGKIVNSKTDLQKATVTLMSESLFVGMERNGLRATYMRNCRHALYSKNCGAFQPIYTEAHSVTEVIGLTLTIPTISGVGENYYTGGIVAIPDGSLRYITSYSGNRVIMNRPSQYLNNATFPVGVDLSAGCNHTTSDCAERFNNLGNFGGFPYLPFRNPFDGSSII